MVFYRHKEDGVNLQSTYVARIANPRDLVIGFALYFMRNAG